MNTDRHTPGPWIIAASGVVGYTTANRGFAIIATIESQGEGREWVYNGLLVAAAPKMLDTLRALVALHPDECRFDHHGNCQAHSLGRPCEIAVARLVIARATGDTHPDVGLLNHDVDRGGECREVKSITVEFAEDECNE